MIRTILVVCIGNICRSPMAEGLFKHRLAAANVHSAGIGAVIGHPADASAISLMREKNINISPHIAKQISKLMCASADIILVMDLEQKKHIEARYPFARGKVFRLAEFAKKDIPDPYRESIDKFSAALFLIEGGVDAWVERIKKINEREQQFT